MAACLTQLLSDIGRCPEPLVRIPVLGRTGPDIEVNELNPDGSSGDELDAIQANKGSKGPEAPDVVDIGFSFGEPNKTLFMPYKVSSWDTIPPAAKNADGYWYGDYYGVLSFLVNTDVQPDVPKDWADLLDPKYKGHISMWDDGTSAVEVSAYIHGWDETKLTADQLAQIKQEWIDQSKLNLFYWNAEPDLQQAMEKGDVWIAYAWQGSYATLLGKGVPVAYAHPKEGWNSWVGLYGIRKGTQNYDLALKFLDEKLAQKTGENLVNEYYYGDSNQDVMNAVTDPTLKQAFSLEDPNILQKTNFTPNLTTDQIDAWNAMWSEVKAAP